ncbi:uncharacterized protein BDV14DRAFT_178305 [Aspergillus stella-maris]|uniref:uncharacterized protein n=1 Tax=Aspergillus stella-maris TaxID=1810926 RepID=UPI003CCCD15F
MDDHLSQTLSARCFLPGDYPRPGTRRVAKEHSLPTPSGTNDGAISKKRGRPRMTSNSDNTRKDRREQIRYAQRTYRHKKDVMFRNMEARVAELEGTMSRLSESLADFHDVAIASDLHITHPQLFEHLRVTLAHARLVAGGEGNNDFEVPRPLQATVAYPEDISSFGYVVEALRRDDENDETPCILDNLPDQPSRYPKRDHIDYPLPGLPLSTYSFNESSPVRVFQRLCLEHIWRLFSDARSNPQELYRVFRLVPCVKWPEKFGKYLLCLVRSGSNERLDLPALPFYCIGGAGTHYPNHKEGRPVYPENMRLPRRVLSTMVGLSPGEVATAERKVLLELAGLDGVWLDCRDVVGYIDEKGLLGGMTPNDAQPVQASPSAHTSSRLDIPSFFQALVSKMVILGRSPGFRLRDVDDAFTANLRVDAT